MSALDLKLRQRMQVELVNLQRRLQVAFVFVTHDQEEALTLSDRVAVMNDGRLEQVGAPDELYRRPRTAFVAGFIGKANRLDGTLSAAGVADVAGLGKLPVAIHDEALRAGAAVQVIARPEHLRLAATGEGIAVTVDHLLFKGPHVEAIVRPVARSELALTVQVPVGEAAGLNEGQDVKLLWPRTDVCAVAAR